MRPDLLALRAVEVLADVHLPVELQHGLRVGLEDLQSVPHVVTADHITSLVSQKKIFGFTCFF